MAAPRDDVTIHLAPGVFRLAPSQPFGGRLALGARTILRSTLRMAVDGEGVPLVDERGEPTLLEEGAKIDGSALAPPDAFMGEGVIVVGDQGCVQRVWVDPGPGGSLRPGIEITARGTIEQACVRGQRIGIRVRAAGEKAFGAIVGCLAAANGVGIFILSLDPDLGHPIGGRVAVEAVIHCSACVHNAVMNLGIVGGIGSDGNRVDVETSHNLFGGRPTGANVRVAGGQNVLSTGGHHNRVTLRSVGDRIVGAAVGLQVEGGTLQLASVSGGFPLVERQSSHNQAAVELTDAIFDRNDLDIAAYGALSRTGESVGDHNEVRVVMSRAGSSSLAIKAFDCFPEESFAACSNKAAVG
jgi:hypothetical protein